MQCNTGIEANIILDDICYAVFNKSLNGIHGGRRTNRIAIGDLGMCKPCSVVFIQFKQNLASFKAVLQVVLF